MKVARLLSLYTGLLGLSQLNVDLQIRLQQRLRRRLFAINTGRPHRVCSFPIMHPFEI